MFLAQKFKVITLSKIEPNCSKRICFSLILCNLSEQCNTCICLPLINALLPKFDRKVDVQSGQKFQSSQTYFFPNSKVRTILCVFPLQSDFSETKNAQTIKNCKNSKNELCPPRKKKCPIKFYYCGDFMKEPKKEKYWKRPKRSRSEVKSFSFA